MAIEIDLNSDVAVVTGGGSGIGEAISKTLSRAGAKVAVLDLDLSAAERVAKEIEADGGLAFGCSADVSSRSSVEEAIVAVRGELGPIRIAVNNAASWTVKLFKDTPDDEIDRVFNVTVRGTMNVTRAVLEDLTAQPGGRIVNIISDSGKIGEPYMSVYSTAKAGLMGLTKSLAREVGRYETRVNGVSPGTTKTPGSRDFVEGAGGEEKLAKAYPLRRLGDPQDIANGVLFFVSPLSSWITGQILSVSGGFTMV
jgi:NAD(P)-dependent dehydrogenase (short-subunit alcohol dehydrogenase family)